MVTVGSDGENGRATARPRAGHAAAFAACAAQLAIVALVFAAAGAWPTPDTNEAHYLTRARHAHDPSWLEGDFFLESREAHGVFSVLLGPIAARMAFDEAAWVGRVCGWIAQAAGFLFAAAAVLPSASARILAAALFSLAVRHTPAAGEWVIGGCEAKVFAWALVLAGAGWFARGRFSAAWVTLGCGTAVHPLVGGWAMLALPLALVLARRAGAPGDAGIFPLRRHLTGVATGLAVAAVGIVPALALGAGVDAPTRLAATFTYVVERLPHHLLVRTFADGLPARHLLAIVVWWLLLPASTSTAARRVAAFTAASVGVSLAGLVVSLLEAVSPPLAHGLLRYYWFRLADGVVPFGLAIAAVVALGGSGAAAPAAVIGGTLRRRAALALVAGLLVVDLAFESRHWPLPGRSGLVARADKAVQAAAWRDVCAWIREHTPEDACFLTPRAATSFHWHAGRREVVCWKNIPQDPRTIVEWRRRIVDCFSVDGTLKSLVSTTAALGSERLLEAARTYGADHIVVPVNPLEPFPLPGAPLHVAGGYAVHRIDTSERSP